jgi:IS1 family transposase
MLNALPMVEGIDTKSFGGGKVNFGIRYTGKLDNLWQALQELGLSHEATDNYFIIR